jgi:DNA processing protein
VSACDACLRRTALLELLGPWIARALSEKRPLAEILALDDAKLVKGLCGHKRAAVEGPLREFDPGAARSAAAARGMKVVCRHAPGYPPALQDAADAPAALHLIGDAGLLARTAAGAVAIVGSRKATEYGLETARALGRDLAACDVPVVSGMAYGIDSAAHEGALAAQGPTIAVMPGGADVVYPSTKWRLHERIKAAALVIAERPPGARPFRWSFPARNRIMAALTRMTVVVEGAEGSGSLITAGFAQDLGREVGAVPGQVTSRVAVGPNRLLSEGAVVVRSASDVLDAVYGPSAAPGADGRPPRPSPAARLEPRLRRLLESVEAGACSVEALAAGGEAVADVLAGLSELEFGGFVKRGPGGDYVRRA